MIHKKVPYNTLNKNPKGYCEFLPEGFGTKKFPILFWLHGLGECGDGSDSSLNKVYNVTIAQWLKTNNVPFIVIVPQDFSGYWNSGTQSITEFVRWCNNQYDDHIDNSQRHIAGLSSGGYALRDLVASNSDIYKQFATLTPMSTNFEAAVPHVQRIIDNDQHIWFHHGVNDGGANNINTVVHFHDSLYKLDKTRGLLTAYVSMGHSAWHEVYDSSGRNKQQLTVIQNNVPCYNWLPNDPDWYSWLLAHGKTTEPPVEPEEPVFIISDSMEVKDGKITAQGTDNQLYSWTLV